MTTASTAGSGRPVLAAIILVGLAATAAGDSPQCYPDVYTRWSLVDCGNGLPPGCVATLVACADDVELPPPPSSCALTPCTGSCYYPYCGGAHETSAFDCRHGRLPKQSCPDGTTMASGLVLHACANDGCTLGSGACTCTGTCEGQTCGAPQAASCDPYKPDETEACGDGADDDCDGSSDEGCALPGPPAPGGPMPPRPDPGGGGGCNKGSTAGADPILLATRAAVTEPFADFRVETGLGSLGLTRTYSSADRSYRGGPRGVFGLGWRHDWEGSLRCDGEACVAILGAGAVLRFNATGAPAPSLGGGETWSIHTARPGGTVRNPHLLARRPNGTWIVFAPDGSELHFETVCDAYGPADADPVCGDASVGGIARLIKAVDPAGRAVQVDYDRPRGTLLSLSDALGHALELRSASACADGLASSLVYDGMEVAAYGYGPGPTLERAADGDGNALREYAYDEAGRLLSVRSEAGDTVASFAYDAQGRAVGVVDKGSSVAVDYDHPDGILVTEHFGEGASSSLRMLDREGNLTAVSEGCACGAPRTLKWSDGRLSCTADAQGHVLWQEFDGHGRLTRRVEHGSSAGCSAPPPAGLDARGARETWYAYGLVKPIAEGISLPLLAPTSQWRTSTLRATARHTVAFDHDPAPKAGDPTGYSCQQAPLPAGSVVCRELESGFTTDAAGAVVAERRVTFRAYDLWGREVKRIGPLALEGPVLSGDVPVIELEYWPDTEPLERRGRIWRVARYPRPGEAPLVTTIDYDAFGPFTVTDAAGGVTTFVKDGRGRPVLEVGPDGGAIRRRFRDGLDPGLVVLPGGQAVRTGYDGAGREASVEVLSSDPDVPGSSPTVRWGEYYVHDPAGNRSRVERRDGEGSVTWRRDLVHDVRHRVVAELNAASPGSRRGFAYDASGFLASVTDEEGRTTTFTPDALGRVARVTREGRDAAGAPTVLEVARYTYQPGLDQLQAVTDGRGGTTSTTHDDFGLLKRISSPNFGGGTVTALHDARGNLVRRADAFTSVQYAYDGLGRVRSVTAANTYTGSTVGWSLVHDAPPHAGRLTSVVEAERTTRFEWDARGRILAERLEESGVVAPLVTRWSREADGAVAELEYPSGLRVRFVREPATRQVMRVEDAASGRAFAEIVARIPGGPIRGLRYGNGQTKTQAHDLRGEVTSLTSGPVVLGYERTPGGDVGAVVEGETRRVFVHDFLGRLVEERGRLRYDLDGAGNRKWEEVEGRAASFGYTDDRLRSRSVTTANGTVQEFGFGYDVQGNLGAIYPRAGPTVCLRHDALNRLTAVGTTGYWDPWYCASDAYMSSVTARFKYDFRNRRVASWRSATNEWVHTVYDEAGQPLAELVRPASATGAWRTVREYIWLEGKPVVQIERDAATGASRSYAIHADAIGMPRALTSPSGAVVWRASAPRPYGDIVEATTPDPETGKTVVTNLRLPGQYDERLLASVGLQGPYYNWNRWYLPSVGRYLELDPIAKRGRFNAPFRPDWYGYALGNPNRFKDRLGLAVDGWSYSLSLWLGVGIDIGIQAAWDSGGSFDLSLATGVKFGLGFGAGFGGSRFWAPGIDTLEQFKNGDGMGFNGGAWQFSGGREYKWVPLACGTDAAPQGFESVTSVAIPFSGPGVGDYGMWATYGTTWSLLGFTPLGPSMFGSDWASFPW